MNHELYEKHLLYFRLFSQHAPIGMVEYVGGRNGLPNGMASSFECLMAFKDLATTDSKILNAGAGASSFVLRHIFPNIVCTDPDRDYLEAVKDICFLAGLNTDNFIAIEKQSEVLKLNSDYTLYDFGNHQRMPFLENHIKITKHALYIDDTDDRADCLEYRNFVQNNFSQYKLTDARFACDSYGRWGIILSKD
jgi:hypothetical protein